MATITTNTFLEDGARTAGENWTMNGGILTIRTDTRWHGNAPADMTGSLGSVSISATLGGGVLLDATKVRWMAYDSGSGNVPAIGTTITQGGTSGYLLGVWASLSSAPSTVDSAMPTTGFLKFREVTGQFAIGALVGISANATEPDRVGWIEVVQRQAVANVVPRLGFYRTRGDWFELGTTTGIAGQQIQIPTNGGGAGTHVPALWIETGEGTNIYEAYPSLLSTWFTSTNLDTDQRCKFVQTLGNGLVRIGSDGTNNAGYLPPANCRIRIPNILGRQSTSAGGDANNLVPHTTVATRPDFTTTSAGDIDFEYFMNDWYHLFASAFRVRIVNCATFDAHSSSNEASPTELTNYVVGASIAGQTLTLTNNSLGGTISDCRFVRPDATTNGHSASVTGCSNYVITNMRSGIVTYARSTGNVLFNQCRNLIITNLITYAATLVFTTCSNVSVTGLNYIDRIKGVTNATTGKYAVQCTVSCDNILVDDVILSYGTSLGPYLGVFNASNSSNLTFRNLGTRQTPIDVNPTFAPAYVFQDSGNNDGVRVQRCYLLATRTSPYITVNTSKNILLESVHGTVGAVQTLSINTFVKGVRGTSASTTGGASVYGTHYFDQFVNDTQGILWFAMNEPTAFSYEYVTLTAGTGAGFTSAGEVSLPNLNDSLEIEFPYYILGHTAFRNTAPTITATNSGNMSFQYDLDTGSGFSGTYKALTQANLILETISASGFKLRLLITTTTANATNAVRYVQIFTTSTAEAQTNNLYVLDTSTLTITGLAPSSEVRFYSGTDPDTSILLGGIELSGTSFTLTHSLSNVEGYVHVFALGYQPIKLFITYQAVDTTIPVQQVVDRVYFNN
jgi:hypothetical protein